MTIRCKTCGTELQNPFDRYGETAKKWLGVHGRGQQSGNVKHELATNDNGELPDNQKLLIKLVDYIYNQTHDNHGERLDAI